MHKTRKSLDDQQMIMHDHNFEMPTPCQKCGKIFELNDGIGSEKWYPLTIICNDNRLLMIQCVMLPYPLSSAHEIWQMAREMDHNEFCEYYNKLITPTSKADE